MHSKKSEKLISVLKEIAEKARPPEPGQPGYSPACVYSMDDKLSLNFTNFIRGLLKENNLSERFSEKLVRTSPHPKNEQDDLIANFSEELSSFKDKVFAEFKVIAEPIRAMELARLQCDWVIAALRFAIPFVQYEIKHVRVGYEGEALRG